MEVGKIMGKIWGIGMGVRKILEVEFLKNSTKWGGERSKQKPRVKAQQISRVFWKIRK